MVFSVSVRLPPPPSVGRSTCVRIIGGRGHGDEAVPDAAAQVLASMVNSVSAGQPDLDVAAHVFAFRVPVGLEWCRPRCCRPGAAGSRCSTRRPPRSSTSPVVGLQVSDRVIAAAVEVELAAHGVHVHRAAMQRGHRDVAAQRVEVKADTRSSSGPVTVTWAP